MDALGRCEVLVFLGAFLSGFELVNVLNLGRPALLDLLNLAGSLPRFRCERPRSPSQGSQDRKDASTARTFLSVDEAIVPAGSATGSKTIASLNPIPFVGPATVTATLGQVSKSTNLQVIG
jgi:hypothetical protein